MRTIYMDNAATSYPKPDGVYTAVDCFSRDLGGNPGRGSSTRTVAAGTVLLETREALAKLFNITDSSRIAFTLNVTEAINVGLKGILKPGEHVITTSMEHNAVARPLYGLANRGVEWTRVACASDGSLDPEDIKKAIQPNTRMICMLHASNLTGTIMPIGDIGKIAREHGLLFMVDSAQTAGVVPVDVEQHGIDILGFTGHKGLLGPQGTGGIYIKPGVTVVPLKEGGTGSLSEYLEQPAVMPDMLESGTPNTPGIAGLLAGINFIQQEGVDRIRQQETNLADMLLAGLQEISRTTVYGSRDSSQRTAVVSFNLNGMDCGEVSMVLDHRYGIITRSGLHCAPLAHQTLGTLARGACRLSPGYFSSEEDIMKVIKAVHAIARGLD